VNGSCATGYYNQPAISCGNGTVTVDGVITLRRAQCCPVSYDGEDEFVCVSERHEETGGGIGNGFSCVKVSAMVSLLRVGLLVGAVVCALLFVGLSVCVWRYCVKVPEEQQLALPQYAQPLMIGAHPPVSFHRPQPAAAYQPPAPSVAPVSS